MNTKAESVIFIQGAQVFDGTGSASFEGSVLVKDGHIDSVERGPVQAPPNARVLDGRGRTLLPGLMDCHVHLGYSGNPNTPAEARDPFPFVAWRAYRSAQATLRAGFTTVRSLGGRERICIHLRQAIDQGMVEGPRILAAGQGICMTGGHGHTFGREADGTDEVRKAVREQLKAGAHVIKFFATGGVMTDGVDPRSPQLDFDELQAGIEEAHKAGRKAAAHAQASQGIRNAVLAGVDSIEHGIWMEDDIIEMMKERGTYFVPTLVAPRAIVEGGTQAGIPAYAVRKAEAVLEDHMDSFARAFKAGSPIAMGTDAGTPLNRHGNNAHELTLMVLGGMSPAQALTAATRSAADLLGVLEERGTIEAGKAADLVLIQGDPLDDITLLEDSENILTVLKDGVPAKLTKGVEG